MMLTQQFPDISLDDTLFVFALEAEAGDVFANVNTVFTGIGKVNAAIGLSKAIAARRPKLIVNLGSAGSQRHGKGAVVCCTRFVQRDMDVTRWALPATRRRCLISRWCWSMARPFPAWPLRLAAAATASRSTMAMRLMTWSTWRPTCWR